jgi:hypothetical protein
MIVIQAIPKHEFDAYKMLRDKVSREAATWYWANKAKTRLQHVRSKGYIKVRGADGLLIARVYPKVSSDLFYLAEKLFGRLIAWFEEELIAVNIQFAGEETPKKKRKK